MNYTLEQIRLAWLKSALSMWLEGIKDEHQSPRIKQMFRRCGWGFWVDDADGYRNNAKHAWCGIFQAAAGLRIGDHIEDGACVPVMLDPQVAKTCLPSTQRIASRRKWRAAGTVLPTCYSITNGRAVIETGDDQTAEPIADLRDVLLPGVVCTISARTYGDARDTLGGHYVMIESFDGELVQTVEGNAFGLLPDGTRGEGVVRCVRPVDVFRRIYHFGLEHFDRMDAGEGVA